MTAGTAIGGAGPRRAARADHRQVARAVRRAGTSFYWAMRMMDRERRRALFAIYGFCRAVDDIADEPGARDEKTRALAAWRDRIAALARGAPGATPLERALAEAIDRFGLREEDFAAIIAGMEMDVAGPIVAPDLDTFDLYIDRVACAVGRLCVKVFGIEPHLGPALAEHQGRALQITNILRDVAEDARHGRLYLPAPLLDRYGITSRDPAAVATHPALPELLLGLARRAAAEFSATRAVLAEAREGDLRAAWAMLAVYEDSLYQLIKRGFRPEKGRPAKLKGRLRKLAIALKALLRPGRRG
ncbi:MAG: squalene synthase HpnD [Rhodothalassiaceae bacterium]|nr:MAG: squalene synthase HpnD [Rhodothalassiaceae bacterium]